MKKNLHPSSAWQIRDVVPAYFNENFTLELKRSRLLAFDLYVNKEVIDSVGYCALETLMDGSQREHCITLEPNVCAMSIVLLLSPMYVKMSPRA